MIDVAYSDISHSECEFEQKVRQVEKQMWIYSNTFVMQIDNSKNQFL